jgi:hypothetical protein
MINYKV